jgi:ABC-2 type transport system ATP-binding protein
MQEASSTAATPVIDLQAVGKEIGGRQVLSDLSLTVRAGMLFGLLGPNGAGKTTTLRCLLGLLAPTRGTVRVLGLEPAREGRRVRARVGVLLENDGLYDRLSAWRNLGYHARIHRLAPAAAAERGERLLRTFALWERRGEVVATWSKGMRQKLAIARALLHRPPLVLLDEPFSGLDPGAALDLRQQLRELVTEDGTAVLMTTHDLHHVEKICDEVAVMGGGRVLSSGPIAELTAGAAVVAVRAAGAGLTTDVMGDLCREGVALGYEPADGGMLIRCRREQADRLGAELIKRGVLLREIYVVRSTLEDAFLSLTKAGAQGEEVSS